MYNMHIECMCERCYMRKQRQIEASKRYAAKNAEHLAEYHRKWTLAKKYDITVEEYEALTKQQNNRCGCCGRPETAVWKGQVRDLAVDYDYVNKRVRRLVCSSCLYALKFIEKNSERANNAIAYLNQFRKRKPGKLL